MRELTPEPTLVIGDGITSTLGVSVQGGSIRMRQGMGSSLRGRMRQGMRGHSGQRLAGLVSAGCGAGETQRPHRNIHFGGAVVSYPWVAPAVGRGVSLSLLERADILCLRALGALGHIEFDLLVLVQ